MKKISSFLVILIPVFVFSANPPPPGLPDDPIAVPIDAMIYILFTAGIAFGGFIIFKKK